MYFESIFEKLSSIVVLKRLIVLCVNFFSFLVLWYSKRVSSSCENTCDKSCQQESHPSITWTFFDSIFFDFPWRFELSGVNCKSPVVNKPWQEVDTLKPSQMKWKKNGDFLPLFKVPQHTTNLGMRCSWQAKSMAKQGISCPFVLPKFWLGRSQGT